MIVIPNEELHRVELGDGRAAYLEPEEISSACATAKLTGETLATIIGLRVSAQAVCQDETERRYSAVRMALDGEWGGLRRALDLWGVEPLQRATEARTR